MSVTLVRPKIRLAVLNKEPLPAWLQRHTRMNYIINVVLSAPPWVDRKALNALQKAAREKTRRTGVPHVLDHIVPVTHPYVCGLTVPWNLRIVPGTVNAFKGNSWSPDQDDLFNEPQQFKLFLVGRTDE